MVAAFAALGAVVGLAALMVSRYLMTRVADDLGRSPTNLPVWSYGLAVLVGAVSLARNESEPASSTLLVMLSAILLLVQGPIDLVHHRLVRWMSVTALLTAVVVVVADAMLRNLQRSAMTAVLVALTVVVAYGFLHRLSPSSLGWGDVVLVAPLSISIAYVAVERVVAWQLAASVTGAIHAAVARLQRGERSIAFGPHLLVAAWLTMLISV